MNSLVLKPWRWVAFLLVIAGVVPSSGLRPGTGSLAAGLAGCLVAGLADCLAADLVGCLAGVFTGAWIGLCPVLLATALPRRGCVSRRRGAELAFLGRRAKRSSSWIAGVFLLPRFSTWISRPWIEGSGPTRKIWLPGRERYGCAAVAHFY